METGVAIQLVSNQVNNLNCESLTHCLPVPSSSPLISTSLTVNELRKDLRQWIAPPDPSVNFNTASDAHQEGTAAWCTEGSTLASWKASGSLLWIHGKRIYFVTVLVLLVTKDIPG